jgi:hypothetical protein
MHGKAKLSEAAQAINSPGLFPHTLQGRHQYPHQQRNNSNYHQQLYQREAR